MHMHSSSPHPTPAPSAIWLPIFAGLCASLVSIGLARFAYTPLIPSLIQAHWFSASDVVCLGAANLVGYLIGALIGHPLARRTSNKTALRLMMLAVTLAFFACGFPLSVGWFFGWRLLSGIAGGAIMVLVAATVLPQVPAARKGLASGAIFLGIGLGIAGSGTIVPPLLSLGLQQTWFGLGLLALILTAASWFGWPTTAKRPPQRRRMHRRPPPPTRTFTCCSPNTRSWQPGWCRPWCSWWITSPAGSMPGHMSAH
jgi:MFS family permease